MSEIERDPSVSHEPFGEDRHESPDHLADEPASVGSVPAPAGREAAEHNVWDEPAYRAAGAGPPQNALTYDRWYRATLGRTSAGWSWTVTLLAMASGGPFAVAGAVLKQEIFPHPLTAFVIAPVLEEMLKVGAALLVLETCPYLFRSGRQILVAVIGSALVFATLENLLYLHVYVPDPAPDLQLWRWTVCTTLHVGATTIAGLGLLRMFRLSRPVSGRTEYAKPRVPHAFPYIVGAVILHGTYNLFGFFYGGLLDPF